MSHQYFYSYYYSAIFDSAVCHHTMLIRCLPCVAPHQHILDQHLILPPDFWKAISQDSWGNPIVSCGNRLSHSAMVYESSGIVALDDYQIADNAPSPIFLLPTPLTVLNTNPIKDTSVGAICDFVNRSMEYQKGSTCPNTTAQDAMNAHTGVCQDFAHIMIGLCRANAIPARYVVGMIEGEGETHAWVEIWKEGNWIAFDPTNNIRIHNGYIKIAHGRDAADCQVCRGTYKGIATESHTVAVKVQHL